MAILTARFPERSNSGGVGCDLNESDRSIARKRADRTANAGAIGEASIEQHKAIQLDASGGERSHERNHAVDGESLARRCQACLADLAREPIARDSIHFGARPVDALFLISTNDLRNTLLRVARRGVPLSE